MLASVVKSTILYCTILYYTILYYTILYYTILYYTVLYCTILYCTILYYTILYSFSRNSVCILYYFQRLIHVMYTRRLLNSLKKWFAQPMLAKKRYQACCIALIMSTISYQCVASLISRSSTCLLRAYLFQASVCIDNTFEHFHWIDPLLSK